MINNLVKLGAYILLAREAAVYIATTRHYREQEMNRKSAASAVTGSLIGISLGIAAGILFAPRSGKETREIISSTASEKFKNLQNELAERTRRFEETLSRKKDEFCAETEETEAAAVE